MSRELVSSLIRIIQDYCFKKNINLLVHEFSITVAPKASCLIENSKMTYDNFKEISERRRDFFISNDLNVHDFTRKLYYAINYEIGFCNFPSFLESILEFKRRVENGLAKAKGLALRDEDTLRGFLAVYITDDTFLEARTSFGNSDIIVPSEKTIIETKIWKGKQYYDDGFPELESYLLAMHYKEGYYVIFDYSQNDNLVVSACGEVFDYEYNSLLIHVIFIRMNKTAPSQIGKASRKWVCNNMLHEV